VTNLPITSTAALRTDDSKVTIGYHIKDPVMNIKQIYTHVAKTGYLRVKSRRYG
jgi:hypothetical protein